ncbi:site-specific integrase [Sediminibacterium sp.]|jgi:integrase/recombinase XerD|uniref:site-specific integrase n=1 Tax=Sediminibacterium sp. TaxID=1917865 RepID=UPI0025DBC814|nr:site-specific integrase [Sediminibacterium sp.]MBT9485656.1 site-specific integrase [Sediminibacterium sp.]
MQVVKIKPLLWMYKTAKNGEHEIRIRVTQYKEVNYFGTGFTSTEGNWDIVNECPRSTHPKFKSIIRRINELTSDIDYEIKTLQRNGVDLISLKELKDKIRQVHLRVKPVKIFELYDLVIEEMEVQGRIGYAGVFASAKRVLKKYMSADKPFLSFTKKDFEDFEKYLKAEVPSDSTISVYVRTFNRLWNIAIQRGYCPKEHHPSKYFTFKAYRRFKTKKRAVSPDVMKKIEDLEFDRTSRMFRSQQLFLFSYYARGINFNDMAKLKYKVNIKGNEINYTRSKNKRKYDYQLHSKALAIIEWFKTCDLQSDGEYVFPILMQMHDTPKKIDARIDSALKDLNEDLKSMAVKIKLNKDLTSYVARHSFATNLRLKNVDLNIIQEAMGHETQLQTMTYLEEIDDTVIAKSIEEAL